METVVEEYQYGFKKGRRTVDRSKLQKIQAESYEYKKQTWVKFIDLRRAYYRMKRSELCEALEELEVQN